MRIVQTFWTAGQDPLKHAFGWLHPEYNLMSWALSCLSLREHYDEVALYTDSEGKRILIDKLRFPLWPRWGWGKYRYRWYGNILKKYSCVHMRIYVRVRIFLKTSVCICMFIINMHPRFCVNLGGSSSSVFAPQHIWVCPCHLDSWLVIQIPFLFLLCAYLTYFTAVILQIIGV